MKPKKVDLTNQEKDVLVFCKNLLEAHYKQLEEDCRKFKWICHDHLPQVGEGYIKNKNVFDIEQKTIIDIKEKATKELSFIQSLINKKVTIEDNY